MWYLHLAVKLYLWVVDMLFASLEENALISFAEVQLLIMNANEEKEHKKNKKKGSLKPIDTHT
eukprot:m.99506 g.99506  ORF g.99506 m.99506 type:complete len:63 (-) comp12535_c0_seq1:2685-2873(-)